jgi:6-phosphofructokinase 1
MLIHVI